MLRAGWGLGLATSFQAWPFQCRIRVCNDLLPMTSPTTHALLAEVVVTPSRATDLDKGAGDRFQLWPFQ